MLVTILKIKTYDLRSFMIILRVYFKKLAAWLNNRGYKLTQAAKDNIGVCWEFKYSRN
jgi:broad-specificity NMP kinase